MKTIRNQNEEQFSSKWAEMTASDEVVDVHVYTGVRTDAAFNVRGLHDEWDYEHNCYAKKE